MKKIFLFAALCAAMLSLTAAAEETRDERITKSFTAAKGGDLEVEISGGDIHLVPWDKGEVLVVADGVNEHDKEYLTISQSGNTVSVGYHPKWGSSGDVSVTVSMPSHFNAKIHTSGGDLIVEGKMTGRLNGSTSGGDIRTGAVDGPASLRTSGGDINLGNIKGDADVKTSGGDIRIEGVSKKLRASTSGGDVTVGDIGGEAELSTAGGDVRVGNVTGKASLKTSGGNIELASANGSADVKTAGGDIVLKKITGSIDAKTAGGNIQAELNPAGGASSELSTAGGDVRLAVPSDAKVTIDATIRLKSGWGGSEKYAIRSDFEADAAASGTRNDVIHHVYKLNGGGEEITIGTTNGNIYINKLSK